MVGQPCTTMYYCTSAATSTSPLPRPKVVIPTTVYVHTTCGCSAVPGRVRSQSIYGRCDLEGTSLAKKKQNTQLFYCRVIEKVWPRERTRFFSLFTVNVARILAFSPSSPQKFRDPWKFSMINVYFYCFMLLYSPHKRTFFFLLGEPGGGGGGGGSVNCCAALVSPETSHVFFFCSSFSS